MGGGKTKGKKTVGEQENFTRGLKSPDGWGVSGPKW